ncbi:MAG: hypothetical protein ACWGQW_21680, partial [bacterium]
SRNASTTGIMGGSDERSAKITGKLESGLTFAHGEVIVELENNRVKPIEVSSTQHEEYYDIKIHCISSSYGELLDLIEGVNQVVHDPILLRDFSLGGLGTVTDVPVFLLDYKVNMNTNIKQKGQLKYRAIVRIRVAFMSQT